MSCLPSFPANISMNDSQPMSRPSITMPSGDINPQSSPCDRESLPDGDSVRYFLDNSLLIFWRRIVRQSPHNGDQALNLYPASPSTISSASTLNPSFTRTSVNLKFRILPAQSAKLWTPEKIDSRFDMIFSPCVKLTVGWHYPDRVAQGEIFSKVIN